jgi:hypothetical protein
MRLWAAVVLVGVIGGSAAQAQQGAAADEEIRTASLLVGKGLFLRGFYMNNDLSMTLRGGFRDHRRWATGRLRR